MSIKNSLKFWRTSSFKAIGAVAALALGASVFTATPASAVADDFDVYAWPTGVDSAEVCINFNSGQPYISGIDVYIDEDESDGGVTANIGTPSTTGNCDFNVTVSNIRDSAGNYFDQNDDIYFAAEAYVVDADSVNNIDGWQYGSSWYWEGDSFNYWLDNYTYAELAVDNDNVTDERHTAVVCIDYDGSNWDGFDDLANVSVYNDTDGEWESHDIDVQWYSENNDTSCETEQEAYVYDLELGDRYMFYTYTLSYDWVCDGDCWYEYGLTWGYSNYFTALDVESGQHDEYPTDNDGNDGNWNGDTSEDNNYQQNWVYVNTPDDVESDYDDGNIDVWGISGYNDNYGSETNWSYDYENSESDLDYYNEQMDWREGWEGQAYVDMVFYEFDNWNEYTNQYWDDVYQGLSDTYVDNMDQYFDDGKVRATSDTSLEVAFETNLSTNSEMMNAFGRDQNTNIFLNPEDAIYHIRVVPNLGDIANEQQSGFYEADYLGNDDFQGYDEDVQRYYAKDYLFAPEGTDLNSVIGYDDRWVNNVDGYENNGESDDNYYYYYGYQYSYTAGVMKFNLTGLEPGTLYSIQIMTYANVQDYESGDSNWTDYRDGGDGGYTTVEFRNSRYFYAATYMEATVDNITRDSARLRVNVTDSHGADYFDHSTIGYFSVNPCDYEEGEFEMVWNCEDTTDSFNVATTSLTHLEYVNYGTERFAVIEIEGLDEGRKYEVVFGANYWADNHDDGLDYDYYDYYDWTDGEESYRQMFIDTLDEDSCDAEVNFTEGYENSLSCYNGAYQNEIFRSDVLSFTTADETSPSFDGWDASFSSGDVNLGSDIAIFFDEDISKGTLGSIKITNVDTGVSQTLAVNGNWRVSVENNAVFINPVNWLDADANYVVEINAGAFKDSSGNASEAIDGAHVAFTTVEESAVFVEDVNWTTGEDGAAIDTDIEITFNTDVTAGTGVIEIRRSSNNEVVQSFTAGAASNVSIDGNVVTIDRGQNFSYGTGYYVYIAEGAFVDANGNAYAGNLNDTIDFVTEQKPDLTGTVKVSESTRGFRTFDVKLGSGMAEEFVSVYRYDRLLNAMVLIRTFYTDANGNFKFTHNVPRLVVNDNVYVVYGRHSVAERLVTSA